MQRIQPALVNGAAGIVGNLAGESSLIPSRVEGSAEWSPTRTGGTDLLTRSQVSFGDWAPWDVPVHVITTGDAGLIGAAAVGAGL